MVSIHRLQRKIDFVRFKFQPLVKTYGGLSEGMLMYVQGPKKWFAKCDKHYPSRSRQTSLATAVANFTKPRTSHFFDICKAYDIMSAQFEKRTLSFPLTRMVSILKKYTAFHLICILEYFPAPICHEISKTIYISRLEMT